MTLKGIRTHEKVYYCRMHWLMLCMQETVKHCKMNNIPVEEFGKLVDKSLKLEDFFDHLTKQ